MKKCKWKIYANLSVRAWLAYDPEMARNIFDMRCKCASARLGEWTCREIYREVVARRDSMALYVRQMKRDESEWRRRRGARNGKRERKVWLGSWVLGNSRRPPNELFSSLPIYFCSLFNQPPLAALRPPPFLVSTPSGETPKVLFLRCSSGESTLERGPSSRTIWK